MNTPIYRRETPADFGRTEFLTREAFFNKYQPGCDEHYLLHIMRGDPAVVTGLCDVCEMDSQIIGHIFYTRASVISGDALFPVLTFGPISVHPQHQGKGVGSHLIRTTLERAAGMGFSGVVITGNPAYYSRFGFRPASDFGIVYTDGSSFPELMALELGEGRLRGISGRVSFAPAYTQMKAEDVAAFDAQFPCREKKKLPGQLR